MYSRAAIFLLFCFSTAWAQNDVNPDDNGPVPVRAVALSALTVHPEMSAPATVVSLNDSRISAQINARIEALPVRLGATVSRGDLLAELDCTDYRLALEAAESRLALASAQYERTRTLADSQSMAREQLDVRTTEREGARIDRERAARDVERCRIYAPFEGVVVERHASVGELAAPGTALVQLLAIDDIEVLAEVRTENIAAIADNDELTFVASGTALGLQLRVLMPAVNPNTGMRDVRLSFGGEAALPGTAGRLVWRSRQPHLPADLLVNRGDTLGVFVLNSERVSFVPIDGALEGRPAPAPVSLSPTAQVITDGRHGLSDGDAVRVIH